MHGGTTIKKRLNSSLNEQNFRTTLNFKDYRINFLYLISTDKATFIFTSNVYEARTPFRGTYLVKIRNFESNNPIFNIRFHGFISFTNFRSGATWSPLQILRDQSDFHFSSCSYSYSWKSVMQQDILKCFPLVLRKYWINKELLRTGTH
jgi:hypothetical protein